MKRKTEELAAGLQGDISDWHLFVLRHLSDSIDALQRQLADIDAYLLRAVQPCAWARTLTFELSGRRWHGAQDSKRKMGRRPSA